MEDYGNIPDGFEILRYPKRSQELGNLTVINTLTDPTKLKDSRLEEFESRLTCVILEGVYGITGDSYRFVFNKGEKDQDKEQTLRIDTAERKVYLAQSAENDQEQRLKSLASNIRSIIGGYYLIHPFYGAVWGTRNSPIIPWFMKDIEDLDGHLSMLLSLTDDGMNFDIDSMFTSVALGPTISGDDIQVFFANEIKARRANPNGGNRNTALVNGYEEQWLREFHIYNDDPKPYAMKITHSNIADFSNGLEQIGINNIQIERLVYYHN